MHVLEVRRWLHLHCRHLPAIYSIRASANPSTIKPKSQPPCRCIRQTIDKVAKKEDWKGKFNVWYGDRQDTPGDYSNLLMRSKFCLALPGDGWSARFEDSILHGCIPVIVMDNTQVGR